MEKIEQLADEIGDVLLSKKESVAIAEATTGGYVTGKACLYIFLFTRHMIWSRVKFPPITFLTLSVNISK